MILFSKPANESKYKIGIVTFGGGDKHWIQASRRVVRNAKKTGHFSKTKNYGINDLLDTLTTDEVKFCTLNRGYGYWLWKPAAILSFARKNRDLDLIIYVDSGTILNLNKFSKDRFYDYLNSANVQGLFAFQTNHLEKYWTKKDLLLRFPAEFAETSQFLASNIIGKPDAMIKLCLNWLELARLENNHFIDDSPSNIPNSPDFIEHRHDQSILSLLLKKSGIVGIDQNETFFRDWLKDGSTFPIWNIRHVGSTSLLNKKFTNWWWRKIDRLEKYLEKFKDNFIDQT